MSDAENAERHAEKYGELQGLMVFMASLSHGLETVLGRGAATITYRAGRKVGLEADVSERASDPIAALAVLDRELRKMGIVWPFEAWKPEGESELVYRKDGKTGLKLVFRNCMIRCALFRYSHEQKQSLCMMNHGFFCGCLQKITGKKAELEILHAGENACFKELLLSE
jgi:predicted hydrocarbon binding protein